MTKLSPIEFATNEDAQAHDVWLRANVEAALVDPAPAISQEEVFATLRARHASRKSTEILGE